MFNFLKAIFGKKQPKKRYLTRQERIQKGREYEFYLKNYFQGLGYKVFPNGYLKGVKDGGIDLLAYKDNGVLLIQCKNWKNPPKQKDLKAFAMDCENYIANNENAVKNKNIELVFVTSCQEKDGGVYYFIKEYNEAHEIKIEYKVIKLEQD